MSGEDTTSYGRLASEMIKSICERSRLSVCLSVYVCGCVCLYACLCVFIRLLTTTTSLTFDLQWSAYAQSNNATYNHSWSLSFLLLRLHQSTSTKLVVFPYINHCVPFNSAVKANIHQHLTLTIIFSYVMTRSQAVARIADRTAITAPLGSRDVIGHLTIWYPICHFLLVVLWNQASICNGFRNIQRRI